MPSILNSRARISFFFCISYLHEKYSRENSMDIVFLKTSFERDIDPLSNGEGMSV